LKKHIIARSRNIDEESKEPLLEIFLCKSESETNNGGPKRFLTHPKYKTFKQKVWQVHHPNEIMPGEDSEFLVKTSQEHNLKCPLTRKYLEQAVTNKSCGHHYSKEAIREYINMSKKGVSCPATGCSAKVTLRSLEDDEEIRLLVKRELLKQNNADQDDEDDEDIIDV